jgi:hypothetical protein
MPKKNSVALPKKTNRYFSLKEKITMIAYINIGLSPKKIYEIMSIVHEID